ncbi:tetratricopeptide repeat protein [Nannocystis bainbridge]|uniref:Tetratricopeptide repeat protein n=1 Tax=Nannocystis bainbridge TaxID=2995303 RepID=A0ABT5E3P9_9BACT|nr:tetratricopeptide repeat protein [Nannocystis bainbridge]MDC0720490.1 tetratricopeptide repeat protein [Nannocystis bainbridge]
MRTLQRLGQDLAGFITGHEHGMCVLRAEHEFLPWVHATLHELAAGSADVFLPVPHAFVSADAYAATIAEVCLAVARSCSGDAALALPAACSDPSRSAVARVRSTLEFTRDRVLPKRTCPPRLVVILVPLTVEDEAEAQAFMRGLVAAEPGFPPWFHRLRIFVHALPTAALGELPRLCRALAVDLSLTALASGVAEEASDPEAPPERRAQALLQSAAIDAASGRHDQAIAGFRELYSWAEAAANPVLSALALSGLGDVAAARKDSREAVTWYERALVPASKTGAALLLLAVTQNLARLYFEQGRSADAETFYDGAQRLAMAIPDAPSHVHALQWRGRLEELRGAHEAAGRSYLAAAQVARELAHAGLLAELRPRLSSSQRRVPAALGREIAAFLEGSP